MSGPLHIGELRVGSFVHFGENERQLKTVRVSGKFFDGFKDDPCEELSQYYHPINFDQSWAMKFGFLYIDTDDFSVMSNGVVDIEFTKDHVEMNGKHFKYVHQFQSLYYWEQGEEAKFEQ